MTALQPQPRPRRRRRFHWQTPVTLVVLIGFLVGGAWWGWNSLTDSTAEPNCVEQKLPNNRLVPKQVVVNVYNGGAKAGTAGKTAADLQKRGFNIGRVSNEPNGDKVDILAVRGADAKAPEVLLVAGQLAQKAPVVVDQREDHTVDVVVGKGYTKLNAKGLTSVAVPAEGTVCVPVVKPSQPIPSGQNPS
ncbi:MAG TPA: LytR C-terminal domain-containing protein [Kribbella sp.]|nr:LytR C-terminal domain-containing protein [Kribbella sp.]